MTYDPINNIDHFQHAWALVCIHVDGKKHSPFTVQEIAEIQKPQPIEKKFGMIELIEAANG
jgi:hypothetical protein